MCLANYLNFWLAFTYGKNAAISHKIILKILSSVEVMEPDDNNLELFFPVFDINTACDLLPTVPQKYILLLVLPWQHCVLLLS